MSKHMDPSGEVPPANEMPLARRIQDEFTAVHLENPSEAVLTPLAATSDQPAAGLLRSEYYERMEARRLRSERIKVSAALAGGLACTTFLVVHMPIFNESPPTENPITIESTAPEQETVQPDDTYATRRYSDVAIHYVSFDGGRPFAGDRQRVTAHVRNGLRALDGAHENTLGITDLPVIVSPGTHDLSADKIAMREMCEPDAQPVTTSKRILNVLNEQVPLKAETLDVVVFNTDESKDCGKAPIGQAVAGDVVIYDGQRLTETVIAHEVNHNQGHAHDNEYEVSREGDVISISASPYFIDRGNTQTIAGYGAYAESVNDKDPLIGYELQRNGVIKDDQIATVEAGQSKEIEIEALTNKQADTRLIELPLAAGTLNSSDKLMLELSTDNDASYTVKAYGAGTVSENDELRGATYLIPVSHNSRLSGLSDSSLNKPVSIKLATGENITLTLKQLEGAGGNTRATVQVRRA